MTFSNVYEMLNPPSVIRKTHFWDWFDGSVLNDRWTETTLGGTPTFTMFDDVGEGFEILAKTSAGHTGAINFNDIRHYSHTATMFIGVHRVLSTVDMEGLVGGVDAKNFSATSVTIAGMRSVDSTDFFLIFTNDGAASSNTVSSVSLDTIFHTHQIECTSSNNQYSIDGVLEATKTTNLPDTKMQPTYIVTTRTTASKIGHLRYFEVYST